MNAEISVFAICVEAIMYLLLHNLDAVPLTWYIQFIWDKLTNVTSNIKFFVFV